MVRDRSQARGLPGAHGDEPIAPELTALGDDARQLWTNPTRRVEALGAIVTAWDLGRSDLDECVRRVDQAVAAGLEALGLPRGPVRGVSVESVGRGWAGRKYPDCRLVFDAEVLRAMLRTHQPDDLFRTWIHESLHGRQRYSPRASDEIRRFQGFEEGMVEGLARTVARDKAGMHLLGLSYDWYVVVYQSLATVVGVAPELLWRQLWQSRAGEVRLAFPAVVDTHWSQRTGQPLTAAQLGRIQAMADVLFASARKDDQPERSSLDTRWRIAFQ